MSLDSSVRNGTLRMFGCWFGRPMDNIHQVLSSEFTNGVLKIYFSEGEVLEVTEPSNIVVEGTIMKIPKAMNVKWSWFYYGKPKIESNLKTLEYTVQKDKILINTKISLPEKANLNHPAVEIC